MLLAVAMLAQACTADGIMSHSPPRWPKRARPSTYSWDLGDLIDVMIDDTESEERRKGANTEIKRRATVLKDPTAIQAIATEEAKLKKDETQTSSASS